MTIQPQLSIGIATHVGPATVPSMQISLGRAGAGPQSQTSDGVFGAGAGTPAVSALSQSAVSQISIGEESDVSVEEHAATRERIGAKMLMATRVIEVAFRRGWEPGRVGILRDARGRR